jgi:hypothetical protein
MSSKNPEESTNSSSVVERKSTDPSLQTYLATLPLAAHPTASLPLPLPLASPSYTILPSVEPWFPQIQHPSYEYQQSFPPEALQQLQLVFQQTPKPNSYENFSCFLCSFFFFCSRFFHWFSLSE